MIYLLSEFDMFMDAVIEPEFDGDGIYKVWLIRGDRRVDIRSMLSEDEESRLWFEMKEKAASDRFEAKAERDEQ